MKRKVHFRWRDSWIALCNDGMSRYEMVKGRTKKILQRDTRIKLKKELKQEENNV